MGDFQGLAHGIKEKKDNYPWENPPKGVTLKIKVGEAKDRQVKA